MLAGVLRAVFFRAEHFPSIAADHQGVFRRVETDATKFTLLRCPRVSLLCVHKSDRIVLFLKLVKPRITKNWLKYCNPVQKSCYSLRVCVSVHHVRVLEHVLPLMLHFVCVVFIFFLLYKLTYSCTAPSGGGGPRPIR